MTDLARRIGVSLSTVSREADHLVEANLIQQERRGNLRHLAANLDNPIAGPLTELLTLTYGPAAVLGEVLGPLGGIDEAYIYGSWAARYVGEPGPPPRDVDILVVGDVDDDDLFEAARQAQRQLGREVNIQLVSPTRWHTPGSDPFLTSVRSRPLVPIEREDARS